MHQSVKEQYTSDRCSLTLNHERTGRLDAQLGLNIAKLLRRRDRNRVGQMDRKVSWMILVCDLFERLDTLSLCGRVQYVMT